MTTDKPFSHTMMEIMLIALIFIMTLKTMSDANKWNNLRSHLCDIEIQIEEVKMQLEGREQNDNSTTSTE